MDETQQGWTNLAKNSQILRDCVGEMTASPVKRVAGQKGKKGIYDLVEVIEND